APPTGWPSAEITRQLRRCVPRASAPSGTTVIVAFSPATCLTSTVFAGRAHQPQYERRHRFVERELKRGGRLRDHRAGGRLAADEGGMPQRRRGLSRRDETCDDEHDPRARAARLAAGSMLWSCRQQGQARRWFGIVRRRFPGSGDLDPTVDALLALLHHREVDGLARFQIAGEEALKHEFVVPGVG